MHKEIIPSVHLNGNEDLTLLGNINRVDYVFLVDSGARISLLRKGACTEPIKQCSVRAVGVTGDDLNILGEAIISVRIRGNLYELMFHIYDMQLPYDGVLGVDLLRQLEVMVDFRVNSEILTVNALPAGSPSGEALPDGGCSVVSTRRVASSECIQDIGIQSEQSKDAVLEAHVWRVVLPDELIVRPDAELLFKAVLRPTVKGQRQIVPKAVFVDPIIKGANGVCVARVVSNVFVGSNEDSKELAVQCRLLNLALAAWC